MFFEGKEEIINKIAFFLENKQWYYDNGIPYTLGIGLHGPPGTGKTSFFKCLSNLTGRHIVTLSLKLIKTRQQLDDFFFEDRYHEHNKKGSVGFDKKIIIIEDIDCMGELVLKRELCGGQVKKTPGRKKKEKTMEDPKIVENIIQQVIENNNEQAQKIMNDCKLPPDEEPITLDDILNLWDGLRETSGRILGITSNHYEKLDPALVRPGRIDITLNFDNASRATIQEMYTHYYGEEMDADELEKIRDRFYSPAEIINCYIIYKDEPEKFTERLVKNISFYGA
jgi:chaperone BCS1